VPGVTDPDCTARWGLPCGGCLTLTTCRRARQQTTPNGPQLKSSELLRQGFPDKTSNSCIWLSTKQPLFNAAFARAQVPTLSFYPAARAAQPVTFWERSGPTSLSTFALHMASARLSVSPSASTERRWNSLTGPSTAAVTSRTTITVLLRCWKVAAIKRGSTMNTPSQASCPPPP
jgi:hypothetical protein